METSIKEILEDLRKTGSLGQKYADMLTFAINREFDELINSMKSEMKNLIEIAERNGYEEGYADATIKYEGD